MIRCFVCEGIDGSHLRGCPQNPIPELVATLRDQFAMAALPSLYRFYASGEPAQERMAKLAYRMADAMMEARETPSASTPSQSTAKPPFSVGSCPECAATGFVGFKTDGTGRQSCSRGCPEYVYEWEKSGDAPTPSETPKSDLISGSSKRE